MSNKSNEVNMYCVRVKSPMKAIIWQGMENSKPSGEDKEIIKKNKDLLTGDFERMNITDAHWHSADNSFVVSLTEEQAKLILSRPYVRTVKKI